MKQQPAPVQTSLLDNPPAPPPTPQDETPPPQVDELRDRRSYDALSAYLAGVTYNE